MLRATVHITYQTFRECLRQPVYLVILLSSLFLIGLHPILAIFAFQDHVKLVTDSSLATIMVFGWIAAVLCASYSISREIENGTAVREK